MITAAKYAEMIDKVPAYDSTVEFRQDMKVVLANKALLHALRIVIHEAQKLATTTNIDPTNPDVGVFVAVANSRLNALHELLEHFTKLAGDEDELEQNS